MSDTVIKVENLSKRYVIGHQRQERYSTLRDAIANSAKSLKQRFFNPSQKFDDPAYEEFWALKDVSFEVKQGDRVGIIGRNGAGKSTLLKILSRITEPTSGKISIKGRVASLLEVGTGFHQELTGRENIFLNGAILGMGRAEINKKFDEIVDFAEVERFLDTPVKHYSSGMYVRLAFAVAAHLEPEILIVDEVLAVGDTAFQKKCLGKMENFSDKEGRTVLFVSHNMAAIEALCNRGILLNTGKIICNDKVNKTMNMYHQNLKFKDGIDLKNRLDRQGDGRIRCIALQILNQDNIETDDIGMGESFKIIVKTEGVPIENAIVGIHFGNIYRNYLVRGYTYEQVKERISLKGKDTIICTFYDFPMMYGEYDIQVWIGQYPSECCDYLERVKVLKIRSKDIFNTGIIPDAHGGLCFCQCQWVIS